MKQKIPLLLFSDSPDGQTGLGRITRDLAMHLNTDPDIKDVFEVGTYGYLATCSRQFPWPQYSADTPDTVTPRLKKVWEDFSHGRKGVLMPITPPTWIFGLTNPDWLAKEPPQMINELLAQWLQTKPFEIWPYLAIESCGAGMKFGTIFNKVIENSDRVLFYNFFGASKAGSPNYIHHGISTSIFTPQEEKGREMRSQVGAKAGDLLLGCVATNSRRKQLGFLFEVAALLKKSMGERFKLWLHTDKAMGHWAIPQLAEDFGLQDNAFLSFTGPNTTDFTLANIYSACNFTILPTDGEGFGYPVIESLACGTPCFTGRFGGQAELAEPGMILDPIGYQIDGVHGLLRPIYLASDAAIRIESWFYDGQKADVERARQWDWKVQWLKFKEWFLEGAAKWNA